MDAVAYQMSFDKEQLALLCANYDRRIDSLGAENKRLRAENAKLRELVQDMWEFGFSKNAGANSIEEWHTKHDRLYDRLCELGIEVGR